MDKKKLDTTFITKITLLAVTIAALAVAFFAFQHFNGKKNQLVKLNAERTIYRNELMEMQKQKKAKEDETALMNQKMDEYLNQYPAQLSKAKVIQNVHDLVEFSGVSVTSISPTFDAIFYEEKKAPAPAAADATADGAVANAPGETAAEATPAPALGGAKQEAEGMKGLQTNVRMDVIASYDQMRSMVSFIKDHPNKMALNDTNISFDSKTGLLSVNFEMSMYSLSEGKASYEEPVIDNVDLSKDPLFSTQSQ